MEVVSIIELIVLILAGLILIIKSIHFYTSINRKKLKYWFYFDRLNIANSRNEQSRRAKNIQNVFSILLAVFLFVTLVMALMNRP